MSLLYKLEYWYNKLFKNDYYYLISMSIYHLELIIFGIIGLIPFWYNYHTFFPLYFDTVSLTAPFLKYEIGYNFNTGFYTFIILSLDFLFLFIIRYEINLQQIKKNIKYWFYPSKKFIIFIEILVFYFSIGSPIMRMVLYFFSLNTIQIFFTYRVVMRYIPYMDKLFLFGSYLYILILTTAPIKELILLWWYFGH